MWCSCKHFTDSMSFNPYRNSLKYYYPSDAHVSKNCSTVVSTHFPPKIVFPTLAFRHRPWRCWNLKMEPWALYFKQTLQVILVCWSTDHSWRNSILMFNKIPLKYFWYPLKWSLGLICFLHCGCFRALSKVTQSLYIKYNLKIEYLLWSLPLNIN